MTVMLGTLPTLKEIMETFRFLDRWEDRYRFLIELGEQLPPLDSELQIEQHRVQGCMSKVWIVAQPAADSPVRLDLQADSDAGTVKGLVAILLALYSGKTPAETLKIDADAVFGQLGLYDHLSPTRHVGVYAMVEKIKALAAVYDNASDSTIAQHASTKLQTHGVNGHRAAD